MPQPQQGTIDDHRIIHYSVGAIIKQDGKYLLLDRTTPPLGFAAPAGHIDEGEAPVEALIREVKEETNLDVSKHTLILEEFNEFNPCSRGVVGHYWYLYMVEVQGEVRANPAEMTSLDWYSPEQIKQLDLESVWNYWLKKLKII